MTLDCPNMKNFYFYRFYGALLFLILLSGCSSQLPFEDIDVIIARHERSSATIVERPLNGYFREGGGAVGHVGVELGGAFTAKGQRLSFQYPAVEGKYYIVYPLTDKEGKMSLLATLRSEVPKSNGNPSEPLTPVLAPLEDET